MPKTPAPKKKAKSPQKTAKKGHPKAEPEHAETRSEGGPKDDPKDDKNRQDQFHVVGIGASAGGLSAMEAFLRHLTDTREMAFVLVQHLRRLRGVPGHGKEGPAGIAERQGAERLVSSLDSGLLYGRGGLLDRLSGRRPRKKEETSCWAVLSNVKATGPN